MLRLFGSLCARYDSQIVSNFVGTVSQRPRMHLPKRKHKRHEAMLEKTRPPGGDDAIRSAILLMQRRLWLKHVRLIRHSIRNLRNKKSEAVREELHGTGAGARADGT